jgi:hypothetical protein
VARMLLRKQCPFGMSPLVLSTWILISFIVPMMPPTKALPYDVRLRLLAERAQWRYQRRKAATDWFWHWASRRWNKQPHTTTKVSYEVVRRLPAFASYTPRNKHICYEDCVHLEDQALILLTRLCNWRAPTT